MATADHNSDGVTHTVLNYVARMASTTKNWRVRYERAVMPLILLIDSESPIRKLIRDALSAAGYRWKEAATGHEALQLAQQCDPNVIILDLDLPDIDGLSMVGRLRQQLSAPIITLSERTGEFDRVAALDGGADDYLQKPFFTAELLARIRVALRHSDSVPSDSGPVTFECNDFKVDLSTRTLTVQGSEVYLTPIEYKLLKVLVRHAGEFLSPEYLLTAVWGPQQVDKARNLYAYMARLRRKIEPDPSRPQYLLTDPGAGYKLVRDKLEQ
jgi:two-component system, OmpR family, KDP operon response regulator KdpE